MWSTSRIRWPSRTTMPRSRQRERRRVSLSRMDTMDLRLAFRLLRRNATFAVSVVATLAAGMGAATAMFAVVHGVLLSPLPIRDQNAVVVLRKEQLAGSETLVPFSLRDLQDFALRSRTL